MVAHRAGRRSFPWRHTAHAALTAVMFVDATPDLPRRPRMAGRGGVRAYDVPVAAAVAVGDAIATLDDALAEFALPRLRAIATLRRDGWSYTRIAQATNLSHARVAQLSREALAREL
jgi:hypothetical protein